MKLSKIIPAREKIVEFDWCEKEVLEMTDRYKKVRARAKRKCSNCFWCNHKFETGEWMALAGGMNHKNEILCDACANELLKTS